MKGAPIVFLVYRRVEHTRRTIEGLARMPTEAPLAAAVRLNRVGEKLEGTPWSILHVST